VRKGIGKGRNRQKNYILTVKTRETLPSNPKW